MMQTRLIGVSRASRYSPCHIENDARIFEESIEALRRLGYRIERCDEARFAVQPVGRAAGVFGMARGAAAVARLQDWEAAGYPVINSGHAIVRCDREPMNRLFQTEGIPSPETWAVSTRDAVTHPLWQTDMRAGWIKRCDRTISREDVVYFRSPDQALSLLQQFALRGIDRVLISFHLEGDLVKFYGVAGTPFFYWFYPGERHHGKFGNETINGPVHGYTFSAETFRRIGDRAATLLGIRIYGGDAIVTSDGQISLIDFNDWPSFAPCRKEAARHIAGCIDSEIRRFSIEPTTRFRRFQRSLS